MIVNAFLSRSGDDIAIMRYPIGAVTVPSDFLAKSSCYRPLHCGGSLQSAKLRATSLGRRQIADPLTEAGFV